MNAPITMAKNELTTGTAGTRLTSESEKTKADRLKRLAGARGTKSATASSLDTVDLIVASLSIDDDMINKLMNRNEIDAETSALYGEAFQRPVLNPVKLRKFIFISFVKSAVRDYGLSTSGGSSSPAVAHAMKTLDMAISYYVTNGIKEKRGVQYTSDQATVWMKQMTSAGIVFNFTGKQAENVITIQRITISYPERTQMLFAKARIFNIPGGYTGKLPVMFSYIGSISYIPRSIFDNPDGEFMKRFMEQTMSSGLAVNLDAQKEKNMERRKEMVRSNIDRLVQAQRGNPLLGTEEKRLDAVKKALAEDVRSKPEQYAGSSGGLIAAAFTGTELEVFMSALISEAVTVILSRGVAATVKDEDMEESSSEEEDITVKQEEDDGEEERKDSDITFDIPPMSEEDALMLAQELHTKAEGLNAYEGGLQPELFRVAFDSLGELTDDDKARISDKFRQLADVHAMVSAQMAAGIPKEKTVLG